MGRRRPQHIDDIPDEESTQDETRVPDAREVYEKERKELERINNTLSNYQCTSWIRDRITSLEAKRDRQEDIVRAIRKVCEDLGLLKTEQLDLPGMTPPDKPREQDARPAPSIPRTAIDRELRVLPERAPAALPAPATTCRREHWQQMLEGHRQCVDCALIDVEATIVEETAETCGYCGRPEAQCWESPMSECVEAAKRRAEQPAETEPPAQEPPRKRGPGRARKNAA